MTLLAMYNQAAFFDAGGPAGLWTKIERDLYGEFGPMPLYLSNPHVNARLAPKPMEWGGGLIDDPNWRGQMFSLNDNALRHMPADADEKRWVTPYFGEPTSIARDYLRPTLSLVRQMRARLGGDNYGNAGKDSPAWNVAARQLAGGDAVLCEALPPTTNKNGEDCSHWYRCDFICKYDTLAERLEHNRMATMAGQVALPWLVPEQFEGRRTALIQGRNGEKVNDTEGQCRFWTGKGYDCVVPSHAIDAAVVAACQS